MKNKGITMIEMVVVVIILILLAIIAIYTSRKPSLEAEASVIYSEMKAVRTGVLKIRQEYDLGLHEYTSGEHYNTVLLDGTDAVVPDWYVIYGMEDSRYSDEILENYGIDELKRNYKINFETAEVEFLNGPIELGEYEINSYEDMVTLMESGVI